MNNEIKIYDDINYKLNIFNKCLDEAGIFKNYPYLDKIDSSNKTLQNELMNNCVSRELLIMKKYKNAI